MLERGASRTLHLLEIGCNRFTGPFSRIPPVSRMTLYVEQACARESLITAPLSLADLPLLCIMLPKPWRDLPTAVC